MKPSRVCGSDIRVLSMSEGMSVSSVILPWPFTAFSAFRPEQSHSWFSWLALTDSAPSRYSGSVFQVLAPPVITSTFTSPVISDSRIWRRFQVAMP